MYCCRPMARFFFGLLALCFVLEGISGATKKPPLKPININTANSEELQQVPGIGPATAEKILQMRKSYGAFKSVDDLLSIRGIGKKRLEKMRKYLTISKSAALSKPACPGCAKPAPSPSKTPPASPPAESDDPPHTPLVGNVADPHETRTAISASAPSTSRR